MSDNRAEMMERLMEMETTLPFPWGAVARAAHDEIERMQADVERMRLYILPIAYCPCCAENLSCAADCTYKDDAPEDWLRMINARRALDGEVKP
jgi:hypothetical protein